MSVTALHSIPRLKGAIYLRCTEDLLVFKGYYEQRNCPYLFASLALCLSEYHSFQDPMQQVFFSYLTQPCNTEAAASCVTSWTYDDDYETKTTLSCALHDLSQCKRLN